MRHRSFTFGRKVVAFETLAHIYGIHVNGGKLFLEKKKKITGQASMWEELMEIVFCQGL